MIGLERRQTAAELKAGRLRTIRENFPRGRAVLGLLWTQVGQNCWSAPVSAAMATMAALSEYENAMFLELMDDDGLFVTAK